MYKIKVSNPTLDFMKIFEELFDETLDITSRKCPPHDIVENDDEFIVEMELAGIKREDITIDVEDDVLTIETERKKDEKANYRRNELYAGKYKRSFILPENVNSDDIDAILEDGILTIKISKKVEKAKKKKEVKIK